VLLMSSYPFFFSYASETHRASVWKDWATSGNHLEEFFEALCNRVAWLTGQQVGAVGYRDQNRLTLGSFWSNELVTALQRSRVLVSIISPHYLQSENCGREFEFFRRRFELLKTSGAGLQQHRIIPIFWIDSLRCKTHMPEFVERYLFELQLREAGMPPSYPHTGLYPLYTLGQQVARNALVDVVAKAILRLSDLPEMPELPGVGTFTDLPSFFVARDKCMKQSVAVGPRGTNVVYAVGTRNEAIKYNLGKIGNYDDSRERWAPFGDAPGATIELATREGLNTVGRDDLNYRNLGLPPDLDDRLREARTANSPVLIVLDRSSLKVPAIRSGLSDYDDRDYPHVGLITAAGTELDEPLLIQTLPTKYGNRRPNHLWTIPDDRTSYVLGIGEVVSGLRRGLQQVGSAAIPQPAAQLPGI
jgi:hypothetical protein